MCRFKCTSLTANPISISTWQAGRQRRRRLTGALAPAAADPPNKIWQKGVDREWETPPGNFPEERIKKRQAKTRARKELLAILVCSTTTTRTTAKHTLSGLKDVVAGGACCCCGSGWQCKMTLGGVGRK